MRLWEETYKELRNGVHSKTKARAKALACRFVGYSSKYDVLIFTCRSGTTPGKRWVEKVRLLDLDELLDDPELTDREVVRFAIQGDIKVTCNCPAHLYWGSAWRLTQRDAELELTDVEEPERDLLPSTLCKHLDLVLQVLPFNVGAIYKSMKAEGVFKGRPQPKKKKGK